MKPLLIHPVALADELADSLGRAGFGAVGIDGFGSAGSVTRGVEEPGGLPECNGAIIGLATDAEHGWELCRGLRQASTADSADHRASGWLPILVVVARHQVGDLGGHDELFDDFCVEPVHMGEITARIDHLLWRSQVLGSGDDHLVCGDLVMNLSAYQAHVEGRPLELTHMEYELLKYLVQNPGRVFTREVLLSQVWGYDYFGGARTVDVHIRRLRSKLGDPHSAMIQTIRSVGYTVNAGSVGT